MWWYVSVFVSSTQVYMSMIFHDDMLQLHLQASDFVSEWNECCTNPGLFCWVWGPSFWNPQDISSFVALLVVSDYFQLFLLWGWISKSLFAPYIASPSFGPWSPWHCLLENLEKAQGEEVHPPSHLMVAARSNFCFTPREVKAYEAACSPFWPGRWLNHWGWPLEPVVQQV